MSEQDIIDNNEKPIYGLDHIVDSYINMDAKLRFGEKELYGSIFGLCLDKNERMIGNPDPNPYLNTVLYKIKFEGGEQSFEAPVFNKWWDIAIKANSNSFLYEYLSSYW